MGIYYLVLQFTSYSLGAPILTGVSFFPSLSRFSTFSPTTFDKTSKTEIAETSLANSSIVLTKQKGEDLTNQQP
jgi:hypothetical protein